MFAVRIHETGGPDVLRYEEVATPVPGAGQVRIKLHAIGMNFIDTYHRSGLYKYPCPPRSGVEGAGIVDAVGEGVTNVQVGDRVAFVLDAPSYAEVCHCSGGAVVKVPEDVSFEQAAASFARAHCPLFMP